MHYMLIIILGIHKAACMQFTLYNLDQSALNFNYWTASCVAKLQEILNAELFYVIAT